MSQAEIALLVSTYQMPWHLHRVLLSIERQQGVEGRIEVVVSDDGSTDATHQVVDQFARRAPFSVRFTTHPHTEFQLARCRNEGAAASDAPYLLFLDGDCLIGPDHVRTQLARRKPNVVTAGYCVRLDRATSQRIGEPEIHSGEFERLAPRDQLRQLAKMDRKARFYNLIRHPSKPKLFGGNIGIWRSDYERINGYDENFQGWGCEDDDLRLRLRQAGVRIESILRWTRTYHLWHPPARSAPLRWRDGNNVAYALRSDRPTRCDNGLVKRRAA